MFLECVLNSFLNFFHYRPVNLVCLILGMDKTKNFYRYPFSRSGCQWETTLLLNLFFNDLFSVEIVIDDKITLADARFEMHNPLLLKVSLHALHLIQKDNNQDCFYMGYECFVAFKNPERELQVLGLGVIGSIAYTNFYTLVMPHFRKLIRNCSVQHLHAVLVSCTGCCCAGELAECETDELIHVHDAVEPSTPPPFTLLLKFHEHTVGEWGNGA
mmetsp:Transcript_71357/g.198101  ORF Transcript_71357/g.198101 Transcript_71357/m.198101 type:complete len:215 (-) Transcript_71357:133-777(-)